MTIIEGYSSLSSEQQDQIVSRMLELLATCDHNWIDATTIDSPDYTHICAGCGLTKTEPKTHWPLYPHSA